MFYIYSAGRMVWEAVREGAQGEEKSNFPTKERKK
jgi:hypothetical protein